MIWGIGTDIVDIKRIEEIIKKYPESFLEKNFTLREISYCESKKDSFSSYAARFAAKEAFSKALGLGFRGFRLKEVEVSLDDKGKPQIFLNGSAREIAKGLGIEKIHLSLSHARKQAVAFVVAEARGEDEK